MNTSQNDIQQSDHTQQKQDHDILLTLRADVRNGFGTLNASIIDLKSGVQDQLKSHEDRLKVIEVRAERINLNSLRSDKNASDKILNEMLEDWKGYRQSMKIWLGIAGLVGMGVVFIGEQLLSGYIKVFFK